jgi:hypothetical protein
MSWSAIRWPPQRAGFDVAFVVIAISVTNV